MSDSIGPTSVTITGVEKRRLPTKHYVFIINVVWSDGKQQVICRRYNSFFTLQTSLIDAFPVESGVNDPTQRILPFLPGKIIFGRSTTRDVALKRKVLINEYLQRLIHLPEKLSRCNLVLSFFESTEDDIKSLISGTGEKKAKSVKTADTISDPVLLEQYIVINDFKKSARSQVSLAAGDTVEVLEKHENGWWFICLEDEQGWAPSSYLEPKDGKEDEIKPEIMKAGEEEKFICQRAFKATLPDEVTIELGDVVEVIEKHPDGWWKIRLPTTMQQCEGFVPVAHLKKVPKSAELQVAKVTRPSPKTPRFVPPPRQKSVKRKIDRRPVWEEEANNKPVPARRKPPTAPETVEEEVIYVALSDFKTAENHGNLNISEGAQITVIEKDPNGWWFVSIDGEEGWVPSTAVQRTRRAKNLKDQMSKEIPRAKQSGNDEYVAIGTYTADDDTGVSFDVGESVIVLEKDPGGWWFVKINNEEGWAPSNFLEKVESKSPVIHRISNNIGDITETIPISVKDRNKSENDLMASARPTPAIPKKKTSDPKPPPAKSKNIPRSHPGLPPPRQSSRAEITPPKPLITKKPFVPESDKLRKSINEELELKLRGGLSSKQNPRVEQQLDKRISSQSHSPVAKQPSMGPKRPPPPKTANDRKPSLPSPVVDKTDLYETVGDYTDDDEGMLSFIVGQFLIVVEKDDGGWWLAKRGDEVGWVPSNFLQKV